MGQSNSVPVGSREGRRKSFRGSLKSPFMKRRQNISHSHTSPISAACNFYDGDQKGDQLNVNLASEEELMTLPGINRIIAQRIVDYRQAIGRFKKVDDLALVSGIGAEKLDQIRPEICVNRRRNASCASSRAQSVDSLPNAESTRLALRSSPQARFVNINTASVFDLMTLPGLNQELAANIVHYRERRGHFQTIEDLIKVKGVNQWRLGSLRGQVFVNTEDPVPVMNGVKHLTVNPVQLKNGNVGPSVPSNRKTLSISNLMANGLVPSKDIFELLSAYSQRPIVEEDFQNKRNGRPAVRIATWNLYNFTLDKSYNPGVQETICRTILEYKFSIIALQEMMNDIALKQICDELNNPTLKRVVDWKENKRQWKRSHASYGLAFIYDSSCEMELTAHEDICLEANKSLMAELATFQLKGLSVSLLNVSLCNCSADENTISDNIARAIEGYTQETDMLIILGDFTGCTIDTSLVDGEVELFHYKGILPPTASTNYCSGYQEQRFFDNIYINEESKSQCTDVWGVVRQGLSHLAIPRGWMWGGPASEHCPVWCEMYSTKVCE